MKYTSSFPLNCVLATFIILCAPLVVAQENRLTPFVDVGASVLAMSEAEGVLRLTKGHSKILRAENPVGTIIVGDDTIANTTVGDGNLIIVTGLTAGSTNIIVLGETQEMLMSSQIEVLPVAGPLRSTVTVSRGVTTHERYECRGARCFLIDPQQDRPEMSFLLTPATEQTVSDQAPIATQ